ncbi:hypothetical protein [Treponema sp.]|uniref:hypothetical protein n=1 Tax=Treponema sp. TaxID=166 RepID=UPI00298E72FE|nr:hypothetical protein [Treponema sp.]
MVKQTSYKWIHRYEPFAKNEQGEAVTQADVKAMQRRIAESKYVLQGFKTKTNKNTD